jgi:hypothetical protein
VSALTALMAVEKLFRLIDIEMTQTTTIQRALVKGKFTIPKFEGPSFGLEIGFNQDFASCQTNENRPVPEGLKDAGSIPSFFHQDKLRLLAEFFLI